MTDDLMVADPGSGELQAEPPKTDPYVGIASVAVDEPAAVILGRACDPADLDILPTGEVYLSQVGYRRRLNEAFRPGGWALRPLSPPTKVNGTLIQEWALYAGGRFLASAWGEADYHEQNKRQSYATALESLKSNALMRTCKDLGIAAECWDRHFTEPWKETWAVKVWRAEIKNRKGGQGEYQWRRKDAAPFYDERQSQATAIQTQKPVAIQPTRATSTPQPSVKGIAHDAADGDIYHITKIVNLKEGKNTKGERWIVYGIETDELGAGVYISTLDPLMARVALGAKKADLPVTMTFETTIKGRFTNRKLVKIAEASDEDSQDEDSQEAEDTNAPFEAPDDDDIRF